MSRSAWLAALLIVVATGTAFEGVRRAGFLNYDDNEYVSANPVVQRGLSAEGLRWAFEGTHASNWHPLTWLSHMLDVQLFGGGPDSAAAHHLANVFVHLLASLLLYALGIALTGRWPESLVVALLFAIHPMHVESVAWVSERKDTLSALFGFATLLAWARWTRVGGRALYLLSLLLFVAGLLSKSMLVTWPAVMLLLEVWPLRRRIGLRKRLLEKLPFFALVVVAAAATVRAQSEGRALRSTDLLGLGDRLRNALVVIWKYLGQLAWPHDMAVFHPHWALVNELPSPSMAMVAGAALALAVTTAAAWLWGRKRGTWAPLVGWLLYLGTLLPVLGVVQVGPQSMADRYTYIPSIGIFLVVAAALGRLARHSPNAARMIVVLASITGIGLIGITRAQVQVWKDSGTLFAHALEVEEANPTAHLNLGQYLRAQGRTREALVHYRRAVQLDPSDPMALYNLGNALQEVGRTEEAIDALRRSVRRDPSNPAAWNNLGNALASTGRFREAEGAFTRALRLDPGLQAARANRAWALLLSGRVGEAEPEFETLVRARPQDGRAWRGLAEASLTEDPRRALQAAQRAVELGGGHDAQSLEILARAQGALGRIEEATTTLLRARDAYRSIGRTADAERLDAMLQSMQDSSGLPEDHR